MYVLHWIVATVQWQHVVVKESLKEDDAADVVIAAVAAWITRVWMKGLSPLRTQTRTLQMRRIRSKWFLLKRSNNEYHPHPQPVAVQDQNPLVVVNNKRMIISYVYLQNSMNPIHDHHCQHLVMQKVVIHFIHQHLIITIILNPKAVMTLKRRIIDQLAQRSLPWLPWNKIRTTQPLIS